MVEDGWVEGYGASRAASEFQVMNLWVQYMPYGEANGQLVFGSGQCGRKHSAAEVPRNRKTASSPLPLPICWKLRHTRCSSHFYWSLRACSASPFSTIFQVQMAILPPLE